MTDITNEDLLIQLMDVGLLTRDNMSHYGLDLKALAHNDAHFCRANHDCECDGFIEWDFLSECVRTEVIIDEDLERLKYWYPLIFWEIQHLAGIKPIGVLDDYLSELLERKYKPCKKTFYNDKLQFCESLTRNQDSVNKHIILYYVRDLHYVLNALWSDWYIILKNSSYKGPFYSKKIKFTEKELIVKKNLQNPDYYPKTLDWFRKIYQLEHCYYKGECIFDLASALTSPSISYRFDDAIQVVHKLLCMRIITPSNFRNENILSDVLYGRYRYDRGEDIPQWKNDEKYPGGIYKMIKELLQIGVLPYTHYNLKWCYFQVDDEIVDYCTRLCNTFSTLRGKCVLAIISNDIDMKILPVEFYREFSEFLVF